MNVATFLLLVFVVVGAVLLPIVYKDVGEIILGVILSFATSLGVCVLLALTLIIVFPLISRQETTNYSYEITSLKDSGGISGAYNGSFLYGVGYIGSTENYIVMKKREKGFERVVIPSSGVLVVEDSSVSPQVSVEQRCYVDRAIEKFFLQSGKCSYQKAIKLVVPKNTVVQQFNIN